MVSNDCIHIARQVATSSGADVDPEVLDHVMHAAKQFPALTDSSNVTPPTCCRVVPEQNICSLARFN